MIIVPGHGSWVILGEIILDIELMPDLPLSRNCGRCSICIEQCPTGAIVAPYTIDTPRCISYLTIEERGPIPIELRHSMGDWVFGCDVCQNVCPYTAAAETVEDDAFAPRALDNAFPALEWLVTATEPEFRATYSGTAVTRAKRGGMARNAAVALGNLASAAAEPILLRTLAYHDEPLARGHAAWALARLLGVESRVALERARRRETDAYVREEIEAALAA
jgi:epoxyqueuosine reductase